MYISIDVGGTNTRVASSTDKKTIHKYKKFSTDQRVDGEKELISQAISEVGDGSPVEAVCIGVPGLFDTTQKIFTRMANFRSLENRSFDALLAVPSEKLFIENDALLAAFGEAVSGAGKGFPSVSYITISTGFGGAYICRQQVPTCRVFEPGEMLVGRDVTVGDRVSGKAFVERYGMLPEACDSVSIWNDFAFHLAVALNNVIVMWNPSVIVIGGGVSMKLASFYDALLDNLETMCKLGVPPIKQGALGERAGIIGGFEHLARMAT